MFQADFLATLAEMNDEVCVLLKSKIFLKTCKVVHDHVISKGLLLCSMDVSLKKYVVFQNQFFFVCHFFALLSFDFKNIIIILTYH